MLTFEQFDFHINSIKTQYQKERKISNCLTELDMFSDHVYLSISEYLVDSYLSLIETTMNDPDNDDSGSWIKWFIYENDFGNKKMSVTCGKYKDKKYVIIKTYITLLLNGIKLKNSYNYGQ